GGGALARARGGAGSTWPDDGARPPPLPARWIPARPERSAGTEGVLALSTGRGGLVYMLSNRKSPSLSQSRVDLRGGGGAAVCDLLRRMDQNSDSSLSRMFTGYDPENTEVYEDELYPEESSSEESVDSEVEFHLYSQIHYSQDLGEISTLEMDEEADVGEVRSQSSGLSEEQDEGEKLTELTDGGTQLSDEPEVIVLSDTADEDSIYESKAKRSGCSSAQGKTHMHPVSSTPNHTKAAGCDALCPPESAVGTPRKKRSSTAERPVPVCPAAPQAIHDVLVIDNSSEEESLVSDSDHLESWMLLGAGADDRDGDIMLNLEGCATPVSQDSFQSCSIDVRPLRGTKSNLSSLSVISFARLAPFSET
ncbi:zinc finger CCHC domain-containing protein 7, partial [Lamprotornis superbus]